jgi:hypothetical protein
MKTVFVSSFDQLMAVFPSEFVPLAALFVALPVAAILAEIYVGFTGRKDK